MKASFRPLFTLLIISGSVQAQTLSPQVISSSGGFYSNPSGMISSTVGEMTMVETFSAGGSILTQGFQQPEDFNVSLKDIDKGTFGITMGPNPTAGNITVVFTRPGLLQLVFSIYDISGKLVYRTAVEKEGQNNFIALDLSSFASGDYILDCKSTGTAASSVSFSQKITVAK
jgi:hypothetical protein